MIKSIVITLLQLALITFLAFLCREAWIAYEQEKLNTLFEKESQPMFVHVTNVTHDKKTWKDYIGNSKYLVFSYKNKAYSMRYLQDSGWVGEGSDVRLQYHPRLDLFRQPGIRYHRVPVMHSSKLINWTILSIFSPANRWLFAASALGFLIVLMVCSILAKLTSWAIFQIFSEWLVIVFFLGGGLFFTWDSWANYKYYRQLQTKGSQVIVPMLEKRMILFPETDRSSITVYNYTATVRYKQQEREIPISGYDYDRFSPGDRLPVLYDATLDDMMAQDYSLGYWRVIFIVIMWVIIAWILLKKNNSF